MSKLHDRIPHRKELAQKLHAQLPHAQPLNDAILEAIETYIDSVPDNDDVDVNEVFAALQATFIHFVQRVPLEYRKLALEGGAKTLANAAEIIEEMSEMVL
jgi:hypothetical protein